MEGDLSLPVWLEARDSFIYLCDYCTINEGIANEKRARLTPPRLSPCRMPSNCYPRTQYFLQIQFRNYHVELALATERKGFGPFASSRSLLPSWGQASRFSGATVLGTSDPRFCPRLSF